MKAIIQHRYGGVEELELVERRKPHLKDKELLVEVKAVNVASGDMRVNTLSVATILKPIMRLVFGWKGPRNKVRGISASGTIKKIGTKVTKYSVGDDVYFINSMKASCMADYIALRENVVMAIKPRNIDFLEAAPIAFGAMSAYHFINERTIRSKMNVLIYGASGSVGSYAVQLALYYGAYVTAVSSKKNHEVLQGLGVKHMIDYTKTDFTKSNKKYDLIFDAVGKLKKGNVKKSLTKKGKYLTVKLPSKESSIRLQALNKIIEKGKLKTLLDSTYYIEQYKEAHLKTYSGHKVGNVVIDWKNSKNDHS